MFLCIFVRSRRRRPLPQKKTRTDDKKGLKALWYAWLTAHTTHTKASHNIKESPHDRGCTIWASLDEKCTTSSVENFTRVMVQRLAHTSAGRLARTNFFQVLYRVIYWATNVRGSGTSGAPLPWDGYLGVFLWPAWASLDCPRLTLVLAGAPSNTLAYCGNLWLGQISASPVRVGHSWNICFVAVGMAIWYELPARRWLRVISRLGERFLGVEIWKTVQLMGILDRLYSERLVLVRHIVAGEEAWAAWNGKAVMFPGVRARLIAVGFVI